MKRERVPAGAFLEKLSGGSSSCAEGPHPLYRACTDQAHYLTHNYTHCAVNLGYYQVEFQSFSLYILNKHTAVKTPRAMVMGTHAQDSAVFQSAFANAQI